MEAACAASTSASPAPYRIFNFDPFAIDFLVLTRIPDTSTAMTLSTEPAPENITEDQHQTGPQRALYSCCRRLSWVRFPGRAPKSLSLSGLQRYTLARRLRAMSAPIVCRWVVVTFLLVPFLAAQQASTSPSSTTTSNLYDDRKVYTRNNPVP